MNSQIITCPMEYGPRVEVDGVLRGLYGECICKAHGETPCLYQHLTGQVDVGDRR